MMDEYQHSLENMNNAAVEYIRGISVVKVFKQTVYSFHRLHETIKEYTSIVIPYTLSWENMMSSFMTIINHIYLFLLPVGILIGMNTGNFQDFVSRFIFLPGIRTVHCRHSFQNHVCQLRRHANC